MKAPLAIVSLLIVFFTPQLSAQSLFDKIKQKADQIMAEQEAKADQKIDQKIDETVDSAEKAVYEGGESTTSSTSTSTITNSSQTVVTGDNGNAMLVKMAQAELKRLGYQVSVDGVYGNGTRNAILAFEADNGRPLSGNVSPELINALKSAPTPGSAAVQTTKNSSVA
jgi:peptidoglycan hydrolase-like protein with peptidoglycan-binding domain